MKTSKIPGLGRFGMFIDDVNLNTISDEEWMEIGKMHMQNLVTIFRNVTVSKERYPELINKFGPMRVPSGISAKYKQRYNKDWNWVAEQVKQDSPLIDEEDKYKLRAAELATERLPNGYAIIKVAGGYTDGIPNGMFADGELLWHSNESGTLTFTPGVSLLGYQKMVGSATGFVTTPDYYESVSESFRSELNNMVLLHRYMPGRLAPGLPDAQDRLLNNNMCPEDDMELPMVIQSPNGIRGLHYSVNTVYSIKGASLKESHKIFDTINKGLFVKKYTYDHWYKQDNDLLLFDNSITLHNRTGYIDGRTAYRIPHDYTNLQDVPWQPYFQEPFKSQYNTKIRKRIRDLGIANFKFPKRTIKEFFQELIK